MRLLLSVACIILLCISSVLVLLSIISLSIFDVVQESIITNAMKMEPDSKAFVAWRKPKAAISMNIYFFNWTNPEDFTNSSIKPKFVECGPYKFLQFKEKVNITWNDNNETISYRYLKKFYFDEKNSPRPLTDRITTINMVALTTSHLAEDWNVFLKQATAFLLLSSDYYTTQSVNELLFEGYEDTILTSAHAIPFIADSKPERFGWFYGRNGTVGSDGSYNMGTSADENFGKLKRWNYDNRTEFYEGHCADINGSGGELYNRNLKPDHINLFSPEICRSMRFNFEEHVDIKGLKCYKFSPGDEVFDNGTKYPENQCFCNGRCLPGGVFNTSACRENAPVFLSLPHFYRADPVYFNSVEGLKPEKEKHELYVSLEPTTGVIADIAARMQVNVLVHPMEDFSLFENVPEIMFPVLWFEQKVLLSDELASGLNLLFNLPKINRYVCIFLMLIGLLCILSIILYVTCYKKKASRKHSPTKEEIPLKTKS